MCNFYQAKVTGLAGVCGLYSYMKEILNLTFTKNKDVIFFPIKVLFLIRVKDLTPDFHSQSPGDAGSPGNNSHLGENTHKRLLHLLALRILDCLMPMAS